MTVLLLSFSSFFLLSAGCFVTVFWMRLPPHWTYYGRRGTSSLRSALVNFSFCKTYLNVVISLTCSSIKFVLARSDLMIWHIFFETTFKSHLTVFFPSPKSRFFGTKSFQVVMGTSFALIPVFKSSSPRVGCKISLFLWGIRHQRS